jgi:outer membrane protein TolC
MKLLGKFFTISLGFFLPLVGVIAQENFSQKPDNSRLGNTEMAQPNAGQITMENVLSSAQQHVPLILESLAKARQASGNQFAARGAFDVNIKADGFSRTTGFYNGSVINTEARQNIGTLGASVYAGYRLSDGRFPIYEDYNFTNSYGEVKVGALFSLLRNRDIDDNRFNITDTSLALEQADLDVLATKISVQRQAIIAYWTWVSAGYQAKIYQQLLDIALERERALEAQIAEGAVADIFLLENRQNITRRQTLLAQAERNLGNAAVALGFYLRTEDGQMKVPSKETLPEITDFDVGPNTNIQNGVVLSDIIINRPELRQLRVGLERMNQQILLRKNNIKPALDFNVELSRDIGSVAEGGISRRSTDQIVGLRFSVPLGQRAARGRLKAAEAQRTALYHQEQRIQDQLAIELENILIEIDTASQLRSLAEIDVQQSLAMQEAENRRFQNGASDFFVVNVREETAANAQIQRYSSILAQWTAHANYIAATMDFSALRIN